MDVEQRVHQFIIERLWWVGSPSALTRDYPLIDKGVLDSVAIFEMITFVEDEFGIQVDDDELVPSNFESIQAIARLVSEKAG